MSHKTLSQLEVGMVLAADVINLDGKTLYGKGMQLTHRHIEVLFMWGLAQVEVEGTGIAEPELDLQPFDLKTIEIAKVKTAQRFRLTKSSHPAVDTIQAISVLKMAKRLQEENSPQ